MSYLGSFHVGQNLGFTSEWNPQPGDTVTGASLTLTHEVDGDTTTTAGSVIPPTAPYAAAFRVVATLNKPGRWIVRWTTTPPGGVAEAVIYIEP
jgi:hypothetical protein